jgi:hypothetical protein
MADNVGYTAGTGILISTDDVGGVQVQRVKIQTGVDGVAADVNINNPLPIVSVPTGLGGMTAIPTASTNGTAIGTAPTGSAGVRIYMQSSDSVTYTIKPTAPGSAPAETTTITFANDGSRVDESLNGQMLYVTAKTGTPFFRWM